MMKAECYGSGGELLRLELLKACSVRYGMGTPCDSFELTAVWDPAMAPVLPQLYRCRLTEEGAVRFTGVIDECRCRIDGDGARLEISGRSPAALLLDTQVRAAEYQSATPEDILERYVYPAGIRDVDREPMKTLENFQVASGSSRWQVLREFAEFSGGISPRFLPDGTLLLKKESGRVWTLDAGAPVLEMELQRRRYGVIAQVTVVNRVRGTVETVRNEEFLARGGSAERVLNVTGGADWQSMRYTGEYRIGQSRKDADLLTVTLAGTTELLPGDRAALTLTQVGVSGTFPVTEVELEQTGQGSVSRIQLAL